MTEPAAFRATFSDWKLIKGRKCVQIVFEVPVEEADLAYKALGGMPDPGKSVWCAVARLKEGGETDSQLSGQHNTPPVQPQSAGRAQRSWDERSPAEQAGIRCANPSFQRFLQETIWHVWTTTPGDNEDKAAHIVRTLCGVQSRSHINSSNPEALKRWNDIDSDYRLWQFTPGVVG